MRTGVRESLSRMRTRPVLVAALGAAAALLVGLLAYSRSYQAIQGHLRENQRTHLQSHLGSIGTLLRAGLGRRLGILDGLHAFVRVDPSPERLGQEFESYAAGLLAGIEGVRNISVAPDGIQAYLYPLQGNLEVIGHDLLQDERPEVRADVRQAIETGRTTISGPYELRQGGQGLVARRAVSAEGRFWGLVAIVLDLPPLLQEAGLDHEQAGLQLALRGPDGEVFFGTAQVFQGDPVLETIPLPEGAWELAAVPAGGWQQTTEVEARAFQVGGLLIVALFSIQSYMAINRRARLLLAVQERTTALSVSKARYEQLFDGNSDPLFLIGAEGQILDANRAARALYGYGREEFLRMTVADLASPELRSMAGEKVEQALDREVQFEWRHCGKDGRELPVEIHAGPLALSGERRALATVRDLTERNRARQSLLDSETRFRSLYEQAPLAYQSLDEQGRLLDVNPAWCELLGYPREEVLGRWFGEFLSPPQVEIFRERFARFKEQGQVLSQFELLRKDGSRMLVEASGRIGRDERGDFRQTHCILSDVSEKVRAEQTLRRSEARFRKMVERGWDVIALLDPQGTILYSSESARGVFGYSPEQLVGHDAGEFVHPDDYALALSTLGEEIASPGARRTLNARIRHLDGRWRWAEMTISNLLDDQDLNGILANVRDLTDRMQTEEQSRRLAMMVDLAPSSVTVHDFEGTFLYANQRTLDMHGYGPSEFMALNLAELDAPSTRELIPSRMEQLAREGEATFEVEHLRKDGSTLPLEVKTLVTKWGEQEAVLSIASDLSERRKSQAALQESESRFRGLAETIPDGLSIVEGGTVIYLNDQISEILGYPKDELVRMTALDLCAPQERPRLEEVMAEARRSGRYPDELKFWVVRKDGARRCVRNRYAYRQVQAEVVQQYIITTDITDAILASEAIRQEQEKVVRIAETSPVGITFVDAEGRIMFANSGAERVLGLTRDEIIRRRYDDPDWRITDYEGNPFPEAELPFERVRATMQAVQDVRHAIEHPDGRRVLLSINAAPVRSESGFSGMVAALSDITDQVLAEQALRESERNYRQLVEALHEGIWAIDQRAITTFVNPHMASMLGYAPQEMIGQPALMFLQKEKSETARRALESGLGGEQRQVEFEFLKKDGGSLPAEVRAVPLHDEAGNYAGVVDLSERQEALEQQQAIEQRMRTSLDIMPDAFGIYSAIRDERGAIEDFLIEYVNQAACASNRMTHEEQVGQRLCQILPAHRASGLFDEYCRLVESGEPLRKDSYVYEDHYGGEHLRRAFSISAVKLGDGFAAAWHDISERVKAREELERSQQQLRSLTSYLQDAIEAERTHIAREIHDQFGQSLSAMKMDLAWLSRNLPEEQHAAQRVTGLSELVDHSIALTRRIATDLRPPLLDDLGLNSALEWLADEFTRRSGASCDLTLPSGDLELPADLRTSLFRIFQECLTNVARHAQASEVQASLVEQRGLMVLTVRDNGRGISQVELEHPRSLGLLGMRERAARWGGEIFVQGLPGRGTLVTARIPLRKAKPGRPTEAN